MGGLGDVVMGSVLYSIRLWLWDWSLDSRLLLGGAYDFVLRVVYHLPRMFPFTKIPLNALQYKHGF
jgi:hypothetical protein